MNRAFMILAALLVAAGVGAWTLWGTSQSQDPADPAETPRAHVQADDAGDPPAADDLVDGNANAPSEREVVPDAGSQEPDGDVILESIPVLVVDPDGAPVAGVPVACIGRIDGAQNSDKAYAEAVTDAEGRALLVETSASRRHRGRIVKHLDAIFLFRVEAQPPLFEHSDQDIGGAMHSDETIRLTVPHSGGVRVHVRTPDDEPLPDHIQVFPFWRPLGSSEDYGRVGTPRTPLVDGVATFPAVPLGQEFEFSMSGGSVYRGATVLATGPAEPGEVVDVEVVLGELLPSVTGIVVGEDGEPIRNVDILMSIFQVELGTAEQPEPKASSSLWTPLDGDGRFTRVVQQLPRTGHRFVCKFQERLPHSVGKNGNRFGWWEGSLVLEPGASVDLGVITMEPDQLRRPLVSGRVVAEDGGPLRNVWVSSQLWDSDAGKWIHYSDQGRIEVDRDGYFEAFTVMEELPDAFPVSASARGYLSQSVEASLGQTGVTLTLSPGGGMSGNFVADDKACQALLSVIIEGEGGRRNPDSAFGSFRVESLRPGVYSVRAKAHGTDWFFGGIENVVVPRGGKADDPRLKNIDLGDACKLLRLTLKAPDGSPVAKNHVSFQDRANDGGSFRSNAKGEVTALIPSSATEIGISAYIKGKMYAVIWTPELGDSGTLTLEEQER